MYSRWMKPCNLGSEKPMRSTENFECATTYPVLAIFVPSCERQQHCANTRRKIYEPERHRHCQSATRASCAAHRSTCTSKKRDLLMRSRGNARASLVLNALSSS